MKRLVYGRDAIPADLPLWDWEEDAEEIRAYSFDQAVAEALGEYEDNDQPAPRTVTVWGYRRGVISQKVLNPEWVARHSLEALDDEYGTRDGQYTDPTPAMLSAAEHFCNVIRQEYRVWSCGREVEVEVNVAEWRKS